jgi:signal peptide peptidase SppA
MNILDVLSSPWAIIPEKLQEIQGIYRAHVRGRTVDLAPFEAAAAAKKKAQADGEPPYTVENGVAVIPVQGPIAKRMNMFLYISGGTSTQLLAGAIRQAVDDPSVRAILLDVDSPGGTVDGTEDLAALIAACRQRKPVVAYTDGIMASAAYWIASAASRIYISGDTPMIGSIGVVMAHVDLSRAEEMEGVRTTEIYAGKYKRIASEYAPLSEEGRQYLQDRVDYTYATFLAAVSGNRPDQLSMDDIASWADGRIFTGKQAITAGLADGTMARDRLIDRLGSTGGTMLLQAQLEDDLQRRITEWQTKP